MISRLRKARGERRFGRRVRTQFECGVMVQVLFTIHVHESMEETLATHKNSLGCCGGFLHQLGGQIIATIYGKLVYSLMS